MQQPAMPPPFSPAAGTAAAAAGQHATPISSRPPPPPEPQPQHHQVVGDLGGGSGGSASSEPQHSSGFGVADHDDGGNGGPGGGGNRWPRQETLALLKIRSEMDAAFREAALKGPLWDQVSRRLEAMGYKRSAKKCREKFENVDKYYKRTKDGRAGRGDGKAYRFFSELEALHGASSSPAAAHPPAVTSLAPTPVSMALPPPATAALVGASIGGMAPAAVHAEPPPTPTQPRAAMPQPAPTTGATATGDACMMTPGDVVSFSSGSDTEETGGEGGKRKRDDDGDDGFGSGTSSGGKMMRFFEGLMRQVMERQEEMQRRFLDAMERREQERLIREEAWRRQEVARLAREQDALAQERAMAAARDTAVVSFIQRVTGQAIPMVPSTAVALQSAPPPLQPTPVASAAPAPAPAHHLPPPPPATHQLPSPKPPHTGVMPMTAPQAAPQPPQAPSPKGQNNKDQMVAVRAPSRDTGGAPSPSHPSPSRWPKAEVHALIQLRTELEARYQDSGPKGPLWEDISAGMRRLGYGRSAKRCKEKWENINKYFKKVKESNKKRPQDSKTCPYYHQLDALYRTKQQAAAGSPAANPAVAVVPASMAPVTVLAAVPLSQTAPPPHGNGTNGCASRPGSEDTGAGMHKQQATNGGVRLFSAAVDAAGGNGAVAATNKRDEEGMVTAKETAAAETRPQPVSMNDSYVNDDDAVDSDDSSMDDDDDEEDFDHDDDEEGDVRGGGNSKIQYEIQFQRQHQQQQNQSGGGGGGVRPNPSGSAGAGPAATASGSFLTMVHH